MSVIKNVAIVGASGELGAPLAKALQSAGFNVTALTRETSASIFPPGIQGKKVDFKSIDSLKSALKGQDAVVSATAPAAVGDQITIIDAALAVGVKRFIPSEFGVNTRTVSDEAFKSILQGKIKPLDYAIKKSNENPSFTWTGITTGLFFDWGLKTTGLEFNKAARTYTVFDSGDKPVSLSSLGLITKAVTAILLQPDKTANQYLAIASFTTTQNQLLRIVERTSGENWKVERLRADEVRNVGLDKVAKGDRSGVLDVLRAYFFGDGSDNKPDNSANALLGLEEEDPVPTIEQWLKGKL